MAKLRAGVLGLGIGKQHALAYHNHPDVDLVAICELNTQLVNDFCAQNSIDVHVYNNYADMLKNARLDIVSVCTPDHMHREHLLPALEAGCHVMQEKPLATNMDDARRMVEAVDRSGRTVMLNHIYRFNPVFHRAEEMCTSGELGTLLYVSADFVQNKHRQYDAAPWHKYPPHVRHPFIGTGCHTVDMLRAWAGDVEEVEAMGSNLAYPDYKADDIFVGLLHFKSGAIGKITICASGSLPKGEPAFRIQVLGSHGAIENSLGHVGEEQTGEWSTLADPSPSASLHRLSIGHFIECVKSGRKPAINVYEGAKNLATCLAGAEAAKVGRAVKPMAV